MRIKKIGLILRKDGFFHYEGREIKAVYPEQGYGVMVFLEPSQIDKDFDANVWVPSAKELDQIRKALDKSDELTHELLGRGWGGARPYYKLEDFM